MQVNEGQTIVGSGQGTTRVDILHSKHPDILNAISVLTKGSKEAGIAFRQNEPFTLIKPSGKPIGGKAGDYILVFKVPEGITINNALIASIKKDGIPSKDYWISIIDAGILHSSYSLEPESENLIGRSHSTDLSYDEPCEVYKGAGLKQKALIPKPNQTEVRSLESEQSGKNQTVDSNELVLLDVKGNPYPKYAHQFVEQFKPDPSDSRSSKLFDQVRQKYKVSLQSNDKANLSL